MGGIQSIRKRKDRGEKKITAIIGYQEKDKKNIKKRIPFFFLGGGGGGALKRTGYRGMM